jgi:hypothetical protein
MACALVVRGVAGGSLLTGRPLSGRRCCICLPCRHLAPATAQPADIGGGCVRRGPAREGAGPLRRTDHPSRREGASTSGHCASRHRRPGTVPDHPPHELDRQRYWAEFPYFTEANLNTVVSNWVVCCGRSSSPWSSASGHWPSPPPLDGARPPACCGSGRCSSFGLRWPSSSPVTRFECWPTPPSSSRSLRSMRGHERVQFLRLEPRPCPPLACRNVGDLVPGSRRRLYPCVVRDPRAAQAILSADALGRVTEPSAR